MFLEEAGSKLLGTPRLVNGKGITCAYAVVEAVEGKNVKAFITMVSFDTTGANSGKDEGAIVYIQLLLEKPLLWLACRHHMIELIMKHVFEALDFEPSTSPEIKLFSRFREVYPTLSRHPERINCIYADNPELVSRQMDLLRKLKFLRTMKQIRDDYLEFVDLAILLLDRGESYSSDYMFKACIAIHKARWMAKGIYVMKMVLFKFELEDKNCEVFEDGQYDKLQRFVIFIIHFYVGHWMEAPLASRAPGNDLSLIKNLIHYRSVDPEVANAAIHSIELQQWYLTEELVPFCLFDPALNCTEKGRVAEKLLRFVPRQTNPTRQGRGFGRPIFPEVTFGTNYP